jgi:hypothetical protein
MSFFRSSREKTSRVKISRQIPAMAAGMIQKTGQDGDLRTYTPYKRPSLIQTFFGKISTEVDIGRIVEATNVHYKTKLQVASKKFPELSFFHPSKNQLVKRCSQILLFAVKQEKEGKKGKKEDKKFIKGSSCSAVF